eukprot:2999826-Prymnesium_polylepis.2
MKRRQSASRSVPSVGGCRTTVSSGREGRASKLPARERNVMALTVAVAVSVPGAARDRASRGARARQRGPPRISEPTCTPQICVCVLSRSL